MPSLERPSDEARDSRRTSALASLRARAAVAWRDYLALPPRQRLAKAFFTCAAVLLFGSGLTVLAWTTDLPTFESLKDYRPLVSTRVYGVEGSEVFQFARERRTIVPFSQIPETMKKAVLAAEDSDFYEHEGVDYLAIGRCAVKGVLRGGVACGGSTITQQVVKTFLLSSDWRVKRKLKELVLAPRLENNLSKDEILYLYLNQIYLGHRRYGVEEASRFYFGKSVRQITLGESALLAGLVQSPERLSPAKHPAAAKERQKYVLRRMVEEKYIDAKTAEVEAARPIKVARHEDDPPGDWYADAVRRHLDERYGAERVETDGLVVDVAMHAGMQRAAEAALEADLRAVDKRQGWRGPMHHLDAKQLEAAMPLWRDRLKKTDGRPGEVLVWDLARISPDDIEPGTEPDPDVRRMARIRPLEAGELYAGLVASVTDKTAAVDLGGASGVVPLAEAQWARKYNPTSYTPAPKSMKQVLKAGDVVLVRVLSAKLPPVDAAKLGKPVALSLEQAPKVQGALVAIDPPTRGVRALVGGYDFALSQFNRAIQARRQPGSAFKPFVWGAAVESRRYTAASVVYDTPDLYRDPWTGKEWKPQNFEKDEYAGPMLLQDALAHSKNTVAVKLVDSLGVDEVISFARRTGIASDLPRNLTLALGTGEVTPLELVNAYTTFAAGGHRADPVLVLRVRDRDGKVLEESRAAPPAAVAEVVDGTAPAAPADGVRPEVAYLVTAMMRQVIEAGTGQGARALARPAAGKTGTAQEHRDAWFVGFTPELSTGVWVGFDSHEPLGPRETGAGAALPAWLSFMQTVLGSRAPRDFEPPPRIEFARIDPESGLLASDGFFSFGEPSPAAPSVPFLAGTVPTGHAGDQASAPQNFFQDD